MIDSEDIVLEFVGIKKAEKGDYCVGSLSGIYEWTYDIPSQNKLSCYRRVAEEGKGSQ